MRGSAGIKGKACAAWDGVGRTSVFWAVQPLFNPRIPLAKLYTDVPAQESNGIGSPARLEESGSPRAAGRSGSHGERHGPVRTGETRRERPS